MHFALKLHGGLCYTGRFDDTARCFGYVGERKLIVPGFKGCAVCGFAEGETREQKGRLDESEEEVGGLCIRDNEKEGGKGAIEEIYTR